VLSGRFESPLWVVFAFFIYQNEQASAKIQIKSKKITYFAV
jgi:hypothetical protein